MKHARADYDRIQDPEGKIPADEPVFLLRGQDRLAAGVLDYYAMAARANGLYDIAMATEAQAKRMREWHTHKTPDL